MFGRKKNKQALIGTMDDSRITVYDFRRRFLYESYRCPDYNPYPGLQESVIMPKLEEHLQALFAGNVDDGNGDMLDNTIIAPFRESVADLEKQRCGHTDMLRRLAARRISDRVDFIKIKDQQSAVLHKLEQEYEEICRRIEEVEEGYNV